MKKSILILALPCLMALTSVAGNVFADDGKKNPKPPRPRPKPTGFLCKEADQVCYERYVGCTKLDDAKGMPIFFYD